MSDVEAGKNSTGEQQGQAVPEQWQKVQDAEFRGIEQKDGEPPLLEDQSQPVVDTNGNVILLSGPVALFDPNYVIPKSKNELVLVEEEPTNLMEIPADEEKSTSLMEVPVDEEKPTNLMEIPIGEENPTNLMEAPIDEEKPTGITETTTSTEPDGPTAIVESTKVDEPHRPMVIVSGKMNADIERRANFLAEKKLNEEVSSKKGNFIGRKLKSSWMREYYINKYKKDILNDIKNNAENDKGLGDSVLDSNSEAAKERFKLAYQEGKDSFVHKAAGEDYKVDQEATAAAKKLISDFAELKMDEAEFREKIKEVKSKIGEEGDIRQDSVGEYIQLAYEARARHNHGEGVESIMEGFAVLDAEMRTMNRSEAHRGAVDKIVTKVEAMKAQVSVLNLVPTEAIAAAAGIGLGVLEGGSRIAAKAIPGLSIAASGAIAGLKEGSRVSTDRAQRASEMALGMTDAGEKKYDKQIGETMYKMYRANDLSEAIAKALDSGNSKDILNTVIQAEALIKMSDTKNNDYIGYSSPEKVSSERLALDLAIANAKEKMNEASKEEYDKAREAIMTEQVEAIEKDTTAKDEAFKKLRRKRMLLQGTKTAVISGAFMIGSQEIVAAFSPEHYGLADEFMKLQNNAGAKNTIMADLFGLNKTVGAGQVADAVREAAMQTKEHEEVVAKGLTEDQVRQYQGDPSAHIIEQESTTFETTVKEVGIKDVASEQGTLVNRIDWGSNGTKAFDLNELRAGYTESGDGIVTWMKGDSTTWGGDSIDFFKEAQAGNICAYVSLTKDTQSTPIKIIGKLLPNGQLEFTPEPGTAAAECFKDGKFVGKFFEVAYNAGAGDNGAEKIIPLATAVGEGLKNDTISQEVTTAVVNKTFDVVRTITEEVPIEDVATDVVNDTTVMAAGAAIPFNSRKGLSYKEKAESTEQQPGPENPDGPGTELTIVDNPSTELSLPDNDGSTEVSLSDNGGSTEVAQPSNTENNGGTTDTAAQAENPQDNSTQPSQEAIEQNDDFPRIEGPVADGPTELADVSSRTVPPNQSANTSNGNSNESVNSNANEASNEETEKELERKEVMEIVNNYRPTKSEADIIKEWNSFPEETRKDIEEKFRAVSKKPSKLRGSWDKWSKDAISNQRRGGNFYDYRDYYKYWLKRGGMGGNAQAA